MILMRYKCRYEHRTGASPGKHHEHLLTYENKKNVKSTDQPYIVFGHATGNKRNYIFF